MTQYGTRSPRQIPCGAKSLPTASRELEAFKEEWEGGFEAVDRATLRHLIAQAQALRRLGLSLGARLPQLYRRLHQFPSNERESPVVTESLMLQEGARNCSVGA